ncbi:butyrophilin-like protein 2 [Paralichthys olivaceus]|uniref:butyrophilin-like protein 2 n=1 Tax=Paralichthys olivaceus TaxID=8255 RepID=UPI0037501854
MKLLLFMSFMSLWRGSDETGADPVIVKEGDDVMLPCSFSSSSSIRHELFDWRKDRHKDQKEVFMYDRGDIKPVRQDETFRGRVSHFPEQLDVGNASIVIRDTKVTDSGTYTCAFPLLQPARESNIVLVVDPILKDRSDANIPGSAPEPYVKTLDETKEGVQLQCAVRGASPKPVVQLQNRAGDIVPAEEPQVSERGGRYDIILQTTVNKTDHYRCVSTQEEIKHQTQSQTYVPVHGAATKPSVTILDETTDRALLSCEVHGASPKPVVQWQNRAGDIVPAGEPQVSERGGRYDIILQTTVTKTDLYRCVSTQEEIKHQTHAEIFVTVPGAAPKPYVTILDETTDRVLLRCEVHGASPKPVVQWQNRAGDIVPAEEPQVSERGGRYNIILQTTVTKTDFYRCVSTQEEIKHQTHAEIFVLMNGAATKPSVTILDETTDRALLSCEVHGASPKPVVQWQNRAGDIVPAGEPQVSERGGRYDIILQTTVTKTDLYRCVSTQEEIKHQTHAEIFVTVPDTRGTLPVAAVVGVAVLTLLVGVVVGVVVVLYFVHKRKKSTSPKSSSDRPDSSEGTSLNRDVC